MTSSKEPNLLDRITGMDVKKKLIMGAVGVMALAGLGVGAASAATPVPAPTSSSSTLSTTDTPTPGDTPDTPGAKDALEAADTPGAKEAPDPGEKAGTSEKANDIGPNVQQTGEHTDPGDLPGSP